MVGEQHGGLNDKTPWEPSFAKVVGLVENKNHYPQEAGNIVLLVERVILKINKTFIMTTFQNLHTFYIM